MPAACTAIAVGMLLAGCASVGPGSVPTDPGTIAPTATTTDGPLADAALLLAPDAAGRSAAIYDWEPEPPHPSPEQYTFNASKEAQWLLEQSHPLELRITNGASDDQAFLAFTVPCAGLGWGPSGSWAVTVDERTTSSSTDANGLTTSDHPAGSITPGALVSPALGCSDESAGRAALESLVSSPLHYFVSDGTLELSSDDATLWFALGTD